MKWIKFGKIFDPSNYQLPNNCFGFAQAPQTLIMEDRIRIYFSSREKDNIGKFLSHVTYVDFDKSLQQIIGVSDHTILPLGELGCFDEHGIFPINIFKDDNCILAYTTGWNRKVSVSADAAIGLAISHNNGKTFEKFGKGPILSASLHEPFLIGDAFVSKYENIYHMWYIFGKKWATFLEAEQPDRVYKIAHATSNDGVNWNRDGQQIIPNKLNPDECQALPTVFFRNGIYHMYFCYRQASNFRSEKESAYRIGYAHSSNLKNWKREDNKAGIDVSDSGWDSEMQCYPHTFELEGKIYMLYNGNKFGQSGFGLAILDE